MKSMKAFKIFELSIIILSSDKKELFEGLNLKKTDFVMTNNPNMRTTDIN